MNTKKVIHFPNLNGLRFLAAFAVLLHHVEQYRGIYGQTTYWNNPTIMRMGEQGVTLFFVLSGFLITYLLLVEKEKIGQIAIKQFYVRRILRIWPLYFAIVLLSFVVLPHIHFFDIPGWTEGVYTNLKKKLFLFAIVTPNVALSLYGVVPYLSQSWSIGTEEQFYLMWPWVVQKAKNALATFVGLTLVYITFKYAIGFFYAKSGNANPMLRLLNDFLYWFRIESMFVGSVFAVLLFFNYERTLSIIMSRITQFVASGCLLVLFAWGRTIPFYAEIYSLLFGVLIVNLAASPKPIISLEYPILNFLGRISYGLYMLQTIAIVIVVKLLMLPYFKAWPTALVHLLSPVLSLALVVALAYLSYTYLEKPFLKLKGSFMLIKSRA